MSLLFIVIIYIKTFTTTAETITCDSSQNQCTIDCIDTKCNNINIYSSLSNNTLINCNSPLSCMNINLICTGNYNQCILSCPFANSCTNSTLTCNPTPNTNAICQCQGDGCPITSIKTNNFNANENDITASDSNNNNNYSVNESVLIMFFAGFFIVVLCCFCILVIALSFMGLYLGEKKNNNSYHKNTSFGSSERDSKDNMKFEKSEAIRRMSYLSRRSYDTTVSIGYNNDDEKDDITEQPLAIPKQIDEQINEQSNEQHTIDMQQIMSENDKQVNANLSELGNQFETENMQMQEESRTQTEIQHEGILKIQQLSQSVSNRNHQKFDSEDLYIAAQTTLQHPQYNEEKDEQFESENKLSDDDKQSMDDIGSDDECVPQLDGNHFHTKPNLSVNNYSYDSGKYTLDGHNNNNNEMKINPNKIMIDITADISAQLPTSPADIVAAPDTITKHPPRKSLLHPPTDTGKNKNIDGYSEGGHSHTGSVNGTISKKNEIETESENDSKDEKMNDEKKDDQLCIIRVGNGYNEYNEEEYKKTTNVSHNNTNSIERMPLMNGSASITETISTFTIKSNPPSLSRTTSLNSAAAVRVAFPSEANVSNSISSNLNTYYNISNKQNKKISNYKITHKNNNIKHKHRNYYSEQFYNFTPQLGPDMNNNKTPPNSNRTNVSNITAIGSEKPLMLNNMSTETIANTNIKLSHKPVSSSMIVNVNPSSPPYINNNNTNYYNNITDQLPPPPPEINEENVIRSRSKSSRKKKKSSSSRSKSKSRATSRRDSIGSGNTVVTKKSKSRSSRSSHNRHSHSSSQENNKNKKHRKRSSPKSPSVKKPYRRNTHNNTSQIVIKHKRKIRRNRHESVPSYNEISEIKKQKSVGNRTVKINRNSSKLMLKQSYDHTIAIPIKASKSVIVPKIGTNGSGLHPKWNKKRMIMTPPVDIHHISNGNKRRNKYENVMPSHSMFVTNIIK